MGVIPDFPATEVHPRSRGEYEKEEAPRQEKKGSPPLTRGIREIVDTEAYAARFTPAHAGNTT